jgi:pentatricopeptide repeat protein
MFVVLGHLLLSKTALVHAHLQAQKVEKCADKEVDEHEESSLLGPETACPPEQASNMELQAEESEEEDEFSGAAMPGEEATKEMPIPEAAADEALEDLDATSKSRKLVWADVEEDDFQQTLAKNQPEYGSRPAAPASERPEGSRNASGGGKGAGKRGKGKGSGKGEGERSAASQFTAKIRACGRSGDLAGALATVEEALASGIENSAEVQNALLYALVHCGESAGSGAKDLFEKMKEGHQADVVSFNIMLRSHLDAGNHEKAKELLHDMASHGLSANKVTLNELLGDRVKAGDGVGMWRVVDEMRATGFGITNVACSLMLKSLYDGAPRSEVKKTLALMDELVEPMDEALCSSAIEACLRVKELELASEFMASLGTIKAKSKSVGLSPATYGSMIKAHGQARDLEQTWATWNTMFKNGTSPSAVTFGCMVEALVMNGTVDDAWKLMHEMLSHEEHADCVNTVIYSTVMKGFSHARRPGQCFAVLDEMHARGVEANTITYNTLLDACAKCGSMARVPQVFEEMKAGKIEPDKITYSTLIKGYCVVGDLDCAFDLFEEMKADGKVGLDEIVYNALIDGCGRQQKVQRALQVLADMRKANIAPSNYTLSILVKLLGRAHKLSEAIALVDDFRTNYRVRPNVQVYTCLMQACLLNRRVSQALQVYNKMVTEMRCLPDQKAYSVLLTGCIQAGALTEAVQVTRCAYLLPGKGLQAAEHQEYAVGLEPMTISSLDAKIRQANLEPEVMKDWEEVLALSGCQPTAGGGGGKGKGSPKGSGKGYGKDSGKGYGREGGKSHGKDSSKGNDGKGYGKDNGKGSGKDGNKSKGKGKGKDRDRNGY